MSQENMEIVRQVYEAVARRDTDGPDVVRPRGRVGMSRGAWRDLDEGGVHRGHDGLRSWWRKQREIGRSRRTTPKACRRRRSSRLGGEQPEPWANERSGGRVHRRRDMDDSEQQGGAGGVVSDPRRCPRSRGALGLGRAMPSETLELVRRLVEAFNRQDLAELAELSDSELEFVSVLTAVDAGGAVFRGPDLWPTYFEHMHETWEGWHAEDVRIFDAGDDRAAAVFQIVGKGKHSGVGSNRPSESPTRSARASCGGCAPIATRRRRSKQSGLRSRRCA